MSPLAASITVPQSEEFERLYRAHAALVFRTAWGVLGSREDAEDVVQTVFVKLLRSAAALDLTRNPQAYLYKAAVTVSLDLMKSRRRRPVLVADAERAEAPVFHARGRFDDDTHERLIEAIARLNPESVQVLMLRYMQNKTLAEIANELGVSRTVIAVRLFRSRARLKTLLGAAEKK